MASPEEPPPVARKSRGIRAFLRRLRGAGGAEPPPTPVDLVGDRMVDQAQAFQTLRVEDVMTPRADIVAVELATPFAGVVERFVEAEHSRMPIYRETLDDPVGVVHVKDVFTVQMTGAEPPTDIPSCSSRS